MQKRNPKIHLKNEKFFFVEKKSFFVSKKKEIAKKALKSSNIQYLPFGVIITQKGTHYKAMWIRNANRTVTYHAIVIGMCFVESWS